jgi:glycosyltransferase involved in cell wall biosynthesis
MRKGNFGFIKGKRMRIAIVHDYLTKLGGAEKVLQVIHEIYPNAPIYTLLYDKIGTRGVFESGYDIRASKLQNMPGFIRERPRLLLSKFPQAIEEIDLSEFDLVISSSNSFAHGVITRPQTLHLTYCYSPMRYSWDWSHNYLQENNIGMGLFGLYIRSLISKIRLWDYYASKRTDIWIAISKTVSKRILKYYQKKSKIIYPPTDIDELLKKNKKAKNYYLIVSRLTQYKNIDLAIKAFNQLKISLYIIGEGSDEKRLRGLAKNNVKFLGWQSDDDRNKYLSECKAFIFPGEDDFGLTPIEAMAAGRPVIALNSGGATETVLQGKTGEFFNRADRIDDLVNAVSKVEKNYLSYMPAACKNQAKKFSKENFMLNFKKFIDKECKEFKK